MERKPEPPAPARRSGPVTYLGSGTSFEGEIRAQGDVQIDGEVKGMIHSKEGCVTIGADAKIEAELVVRDVVISGLVEGNVDATGKVEIRSGGILRGDLRTQRIQIDDGAAMAGKVHMGEDRLARESVPVHRPVTVRPDSKPEAAA